MRRKVIQIAESTQLVSLPRKWAILNNIKRGQEVEVKENGDNVQIFADSSPKIEKAQLDVSDFGSMTARSIHALYKKGADEVKLTFNDPSMVALIQEAVGKETVGFEVLEQSPSHCLIRYVSGSLEEFDSVLRRTFLLLLNMAEQTERYLKEENYTQIKNTAFLEEANNRFTTLCRRYLNKVGSGNYSKVGPLYYLVEEVEKLADQYKYMCQHFYKLEGTKIKINQEVHDTFSRANKMLRVFYELFYKFDVNKLLELKDLRNNVLEEAHVLFEKKLTYADYWALHHSLTISNMLFSMAGPYMTLKLGEEINER
jgi:phosphate uptake regulator